MILYVRFVSLCTQYVSITQNFIQMMAPPQYSCETNLYCWWKANKNEREKKQTDKHTHEIDKDSDTYIDFYYG